MRICGLCRRAPRWDESLSAVQINPSAELPSWEILVGAFGVEQCQGTIGMLACPDCRPKLTGEPRQPSRRWPAGQPVPTKPNSDGDIPVCGVCRLALREDEQQTSLRLWPDDVPADVEPGGYRACPACLDHYRPVIAARLRALGILSPDAPDSAVAGDMLL